MPSESYVVRLLPTAQKDLDKLNVQVRSRMLPAVRNLSDNPRPRQSKKIKGTTDVFRIRIGDYRVIYRVSDEYRTVTIGHVLHRSKAYR